jgi:hypothetical protein
MEAWLHREDREKVILHNQDKCHGFFTHLITNLLSDGYKIPVALFVTLPATSSIFAIYFYINKFYNNSKMIAFGWL